MGQVSFAGKEIKKGPPHGTRLWRAGQKEAWLGGELDMQRNEQRVCMHAHVCTCMQGGQGLWKGRGIRVSTRKAAASGSRKRARRTKLHLIQGRPCMSHSALSKLAEVPEDDSPPALVKTLL